MSKMLAASVITLTMGFGGLSAAGQLGGVVDATKDAAQTVGTTTKHVATETTTAVKHGATKTKNAVTGEARAKCVDGKHFAAKTQKSANAMCSKHGGVAR
jgi:hypothetical protein